MTRTLRILGLLEDGSARAARMQASARRRLSWQRGESVTLLLEVRTPSGAPVDLTAATFSMGMGMQFSAVLLELAGAASPQDGNSVVKFTVAPADYSKLPLGRTRFVYDVWMTQGGARSVLVPTSPFDLLDTATPVP